MQLQQYKLNHRLVKSAEETKIALSDQLSYFLTLPYIESELGLTITHAQLELAVEKQLRNILTLVKDCLNQASAPPSYIYLTGGSAKSPIIRAALTKLLPEIEMVDGDYFGSVAAGLTKWANKIWR